MVAMTMPHDAPTAAELVEAVREWLTREVMPGAEPVNRFHARVAANILAIVEREIELGTGSGARPIELGSICSGWRTMPSSPRRSVRAASTTASTRCVVWCGTVWATSSRVANPRYLDRVEH